MAQTIDELEKVILNEIKSKRLNLSQMNQIEINQYFYKMKLQNPEKYKDLDFNTDGYNPISDRLNNALFSLGVDGEIYF